METSPVLTPRQEQNMTLAPQQLTSLTLLALPLMALRTRINKEMAANPVLELEEGGLDEPARPEDESFGGHAPEDNMNGSGPGDDADFPGRMLEDRDNCPDAEKHRQYLFDSLAAETSLQDFLLQQLRFADAPARLRECAEYVIGSLDENGYFRGSLPDAAQAAGLSVPEAEKALALVQSFDPPGIAARDLKECLLLQLARRGKSSPALGTLIRDHFDALAHNKLPQIARAMKIGIGELKNLIVQLRKLNPHPGISISSRREPGILPEVTVAPEGDSFILTASEPPFGRLILSKHYLQMLEDPALDPEAKTYLRGKIDSGKALIHSLEQRQSTIRRIAGQIVNNQYEFMKHGPEALKPMTMKQVADKLGLNESTVSRAVAGKYIRTPAGMFAFRFFFSGGFQSGEGEEVSARAIQAMIRELVGAEDSAKPLSDSRLSQLLKEHGFDVARRTVAKYREELAIPSSQMRKTF